MSRRLELFGNLHLRAVHEAILRRKVVGRRAIQRGVDDVKGIPFERLDIESESSLNGRLFHFTLWEDSTAWIYLHVQKSRKARRLKVRFHVSLWDWKPIDIAKAFEATLGAQVDADILRGIWGVPG